MINTLILKLSVKDLTLTTPIFLFLHFLFIVNFLHQVELMGYRQRFSTSNQCLDFNIICDVHYVLEIERVDIRGRIVLSF